MELLSAGIWYVIRCLHLVLGFVLFGVIYYLGMFTSGAIRRMDRESRKKIVPQILPAYFHWLKWEAIWTILSGFLLIFWKIFVMKYPFRIFSKYSLFIFLGMTITITITFLIWYRILPMQNRILELTEKDLWTEELDNIVMKSRNFSHICSWLGIAVVVFMVSSNYFPLNF